MQKYISKKSPDGSGIVYCHKRQDCDDLALKMREQGMNVRGSWNIEYRP